MTDLGPDVWNTFPEASSPTADLQAGFAQMDGIVAGWQQHVYSNVDTWLPQISALRAEITSVMAAAPLSDVFATKAAAVRVQQLYDHYQALKNALDLSGDTLRDASGFGSANAPAGLAEQAQGLLAQLGAALMKLGGGSLSPFFSSLGLGVGIVGALVVLVVLFVLWRTYL